MTCSRWVERFGGWGERSRRCCLLLHSPRDVDGLELVESGEDTGTGNTTKDVGSGSLHEGHEALSLAHLHEAVQGALVLDGGTRGHHHAPPHGIDGVGHESGGDGDGPSEDEGGSDSGIGSEKHGLQGVVQTEVHTSVDEDTNSGDVESSVQALDTVTLEGLGVHVNETVELSLSTLALGIVSQPGTGVVEGVHEGKRQGTGSASRGDVGGELPASAGVRGSLEGSLHGVLERKVQGLGGEVTEHIGEISSPEGVDALSLHDPGGAVYNASVGFVETALLDHLVLVLDQQLDTLDGGGGGLGHTGGHAREKEVLGKSQFVSTHFVFFLSLVLVGDPVRLSPC